MNFSNILPDGIGVFSSIYKSSNAKIIQSSREYLLQWALSSCLILFSPFLIPQLEQELLVLHL